jgi:hypothetical protein
VRERVLRGQDAASGVEVSADQRFGPAGRLARSRPFNTDAKACLYVSSFSGAGAGAGSRCAFRDRFPVFTRSEARRPPSSSWDMV